MFVPYYLAIPGHWKARGYGSDAPGGRNEGAGGKPDKDKSDKGGNGKGGNNGDKGGGGGNKQGSVNPGGVTEKDWGGVTGKKPGKSPDDPVDLQSLIDEAEKTGRVKTINPGQRGPTVTEKEAAELDKIDDFDKKQKVVDALAKMQDDAAGVGDSPIESLLNNVIGALGIAERAPTVADAVSAVENAEEAGVEPDARASWGWDFGQTVMDVVGGITGLATGTAYGLGKRITGFEGFTVDLGPDVFGSNPPSSGASSYDGGTVSGEGSFFGGGGMFGGGNSGMGNSGNGSGGKSSGGKSAGNGNDHSEGNDHAENSNGTIATSQSSSGSGTQTSNSSGSNSSSGSGADTIDSILEQLLTANLSVPMFQKPAPYQLNMEPHNAVIQMIQESRSR